MKASKLLRAWIQRLTDRGVRFRYGHELIAIEGTSADWGLRFRDQPDARASVVALALGGGSYEEAEKPLRWPELLRAQGVAFHEFRPSNVGFRVAWAPEFLKEAEGQPLKNVLLTSPRGTRKGDLVITRYGLEGTPIYFVGQTGRVTLDLKPDLTLEQLESRLGAPRENLSPIRRIKKQLGLAPAALALIYHHAPRDLLRGPVRLPDLARLVQSFPLDLDGPQPLDEAISSSGGIPLSELDDQLRFRKLPGVFAAGEMLDWDAPTGGFLIQGCVSQGHRVGKGLLRTLAAQQSS
jgi:uncharacterized flavoprotein (TIGR03862 family)